MSESNLFLLGFAYMVAIMSPGPSLAVITKNSLYSSSRSGVFTAIGTVTGIAFQSLYVLAGLNFLQGNSNVVDYLNITLGAYLIYLGIKSTLFQYKKHMLLKYNTEPSSFGIEETQEDINLSTFQAFREGFFTDALNPIALTFFMVIFSLYISHGETMAVKLISWLEIIVLGSFWFIGFSLVISRSAVRNILMKSGRFLLITMSLVFFYLGGKLLVQAITNQCTRFYFL